MSQGLAWMALVTAGLLDVAWAIFMKLAAATRGSVERSFAHPSRSLRAPARACPGAIPVGTAYAVWTGIGAAGTVLAGVVLFGEALGHLRLGGVVLVLVGIVALKLAPA